MEKESVLEVKIVQLNDEFSAWWITKFNDKILKVGIKDKFKINIKESNNAELYISVDRGIRLLYWGDDCDRLTPNLDIDYINTTNMTPRIIFNKHVEDLKKIVEAINEKYGIPKRWRASIGNLFYYITSDEKIKSNLDSFSDKNDDMYNLGNYFQTRKQAQKVVDSKEWQDFWAKVREGEIGK